MAFVITHPKNLIRLWAGIHSDFESLMVLFLAKDVGWTFEDFAACCKQQQISLIMHCTIGSGKTREFHYRTICNMIFSCAKSIWLQPPVPNVTPSSENTDTGDEFVENEFTVRSKRKLGGFYLLYLMYRKQPWKNYCKISLDIDDLEQTKIWISHTNFQPYKDDIQYILYYLISQKCFDFCISSFNYGVGTLERRYLEASSSKFTTVSLRQEMRTLQDEINCSPLMTSSQEAIVDYHKMKYKLHYQVDKLKTFEVPEDCGGIKTNSGFTRRERFFTCRNGYKPDGECAEAKKSKFNNSESSQSTSEQSGIIKTEVLPNDTIKTEVLPSDDIKPEVVVLPRDDVKHTMEMELKRSNGEMERISDSNGANQHFHNKGRKSKSRTKCGNSNTAMKMLIDNKGSRQIFSVMKTLGHLADKPIITVADMTGNCMEEREMIVDTKLRIIRGSKRKRKLDTMGKYIALKPYLGESGIFGRHLGFQYNEERKDERSKRASSIKSENLWNYITNDSFI